jgi:hypothetical protein
MRTSSLAAATLLLSLAALAQPSPLLQVDDPEGDDVGDGSLVYPRDSAYKPGDLDLRSLRVFAEGTNLRFEATFRNPIRDPASVYSPGMGADTLSNFARRGFYSFNLDIYLDTDRIVGSGNTVTLPGRRARLDPANAWEKAIVLTPRPEVIKRQLIDSLHETSSAPEAEVNATVERSVFFPTQVRVLGKTVSFVVPGSFIDAASLSGASITALVTAAKLTVDAGLKMAFSDNPNSPDRFTLGVAQPDVGQPEMTMGYRSGPAPATAIVDLLTPDPRQQAAQLAPGALLTGLNRENRMGAAPSPAIVAAPAAAAPPAADDSWFSKALGSIASLFGSGAPTPAPAPVPASPQTVQSLMTPPSAPAVAQPPAAPPTATAAPAAAVTPPAPAAASPTRPAAPPAAPAPAAVAPAAVAPAAVAAPAAATPATVQRPRDAAFFEEQENRLRTLKRLRDGGLITEEEYQQKRREILATL